MPLIRLGGAEAYHNIFRRTAPLMLAGYWEEEGIDVAEGVRPYAQNGRVFWRATREVPAMKWPKCVFALRVMNMIERCLPRLTGAKPRAALLWLAVACSVQTGNVYAETGCGARSLQDETNEVKAVNRAGLRAQFADTVTREFKVGGDGERLLSWVRRSGFSEPIITYTGRLELSSSTAEDRKEIEAMNERIRRRSPLQGSTRGFKTLCGRSIYHVAWRLDGCGRIAEVHFDEVHCRFDIP